MEKRYTEKEQTKIFERALKLQRKADKTVTLAEMEEAAFQAGIDSRFLARAIEDTASGPQAEKNLLPILRVIALCSFCFAQVYTVSGQVTGVGRDFYISFGIALVLGAMNSGRSLWRGLLGTIALGAIVTYATMIVLRPIGTLDGLPLGQFLFNSSLVQIVMFMIGASMVEFTKWANRTSQSALRP